MFGPYDEEFDANKNGKMEEDEKEAERAYIRYLSEKDAEESDNEDDEYDDGESF